MKTILDAYIECALWSSSATISPQDLALPQFQAAPDIEVGDDYSLDGYFGAEDLAPETLETMEKEIADFLAYCEAEGITREEWSDTELGHDFWLTRNGHGTGFWDRGLDEGGALTRAAKTFGSADLYVGDDGKIYQS